MKISPDLFIEPNYCMNFILLTFSYFFFTKYAATHEQVNRSAPTLKPNDKKIPYVNTKRTENFNVGALPAKKGNKLKKANEVRGEVSLVIL